VQSAIKAGLVFLNVSALNVGKLLDYNATIKFIYECITD